MTFIRPPIYFGTAVLLMLFISIACPVFSGEKSSSLQSEENSFVNISQSYVQQEEDKEPDKTLQKVSKSDQDKAAADLSMGLTKMQQKDFKQAEKYLRASLQADPGMADAAYNLGIVLFKDHPDESLQLLQKASRLKDQYPKYTYTLAYYTLKKGETKKGINILKELMRTQPQYVNTYMLLGETYEKLGNKKEAEAVYKLAIGEDKLPQPAKSFFENKVKALSSTKESKQ